MEMKISACYIVKNEAAALGQSLDSVKDWVDEIIIVDTGSTDQTIEIAERYGARVFSQPWKEDFSAPRNFALTKAQGDWIVFLDADEYLTKETGANLYAVLNACATKDALLTQMINIDKESNKVLVKFFTMRIFKNLPELRYNGIIHEELRKNGEDITNVQAIAAEDICIIHTGYSKSQIREKAERNLHLLETAMRENAAPDKFYMSIAEAYDGLGEMEQAVQYARMDIAACPRRMVTYASRSYRILLADLAGNKKNMLERQRIAEMAVKAFPEMPEFHAEYAECLAYGLEFLAAVNEMKSALRTFSDYDAMEPTTFDEETAQKCSERLNVWQQILQKMDDIHISACVIVKNEEKDIAHWIDNAKVYSDEIIFIDTGSTDDTVRIAENAGILVRHYAWSNDFSAARNFAIEQAAGDWIVFFDADEYFANPIRIRALLAETDISHSEAEALMMVTANIDADANNLEIQRCSNLRIFRNRPELRYQGNVHEALQHKDGKLEVLLEEGRILIYHTGYSSGRVLAKVKRDLALLQADIAEKGEGPQHYRYLADCYFALHDYQQSFHYAGLAIEAEAEMQYVGNNSDMYHCVIDSLRKIGITIGDIMPFVENAIAKFPQLPDFYAEKGKILYEGQDWLGAKRLFEQAIAIFEHKMQDNYEISSFYGETDIIYSRLSDVYIRLGEFEQARKFLRKAFAENPYCIETLDVYVKLPENKDPLLFDKGLGEFYSGSANDLEYLRHWSESHGFISIYHYYADRLQREYHISDYQQRYYEKLYKHEYEQLYNEAIAAGAEHLQQFLIVAMKVVAESQGQLSAAVEKCMGVLPEYMRNLLLRYSGKIPALQEADWEAYEALLPAMTAMAPHAILQAYAEMACDFSWERVYAAAKGFMEAEKWEAALLLFQEIPASDEIITAEFWYCTGICFYRMAQFAAAKECLLRSKDMGSEEPDISIYLQWMNERN